MSRSTQAFEKWRGIVEQHKASGQTVADFCQQRGLPASSLFAWRRRLAASGTEPAAFVEARVRPAAPAGGDGVAVAGDATAAGVEVRCVGGRRVVVGPGFDPVTLGRVIRTLEALA